MKNTSAGNNGFLLKTLGFRRKRQLPDTTRLPHLISTEMNLSSLQEKKGFTNHSTLLVQAARCILVMAAGGDLFVYNLRADGNNKAAHARSRKASVSAGPLHVPYLRS